MKRFTKKSRIKGLVLNLKEGEAIFLGNGEIVIEIVEILGRRARLAFKASKDITIHRGTLPGTNEVPN